VPFPLLGREIGVATLPPCCRSTSEHNDLGHVGPAPWKELQVGRPRKESAVQLGKLHLLSPSKSLYTHYY
jgi:hypothetical protein